MKEMLYKVCCIVLFISCSFITKGYAESVIIANESVCSFDYEATNQVGQNVASGTITMVSDDRIFSFYLNELIRIYRKKDVGFAYEFFNSKGFKKKTSNEDNNVTITYDGKVIRIVVKMEGEENPIPYEWYDYLRELRIPEQFTEGNRVYRQDYRRIGFPIISQVIDFSKSPALLYFYIGEPVKIQ